MDAAISEIVPGFGCKSNQVHIPTELIGKIEFDISPSSTPMVSRYVEIIIMKDENNVVFVAGFIPLNSAILKNSNNAKYVSKAVANVKNHPPNKTTIKPNIPISNPLLNLISNFYLYKTLIVKSTRSLLHKL